MHGMPSVSLPQVALTRVARLGANIVTVIHQASCYCWYGALRACNGITLKTSANTDTVSQLALMPTHSPTLHPHLIAWHTCSPRCPPSQPRYSIFRLFDDVLLLGKGGCAPAGSSWACLWLPASTAPRGQQRPAWLAGIKSSGQQALKRSACNHPTRAGAWCTWAPPASRCPTSRPSALRCLPTRTRRVGGRSPCCVQAVPWTAMLRCSPGDNILLLPLLLHFAHALLKAAHSLPLPQTLPWT